VRTGIACAHVQAQRQGGPAVAARARRQAQRAVGDGRHARAVAGRDRGPQLVARAGRHAHHAARAALAHVRRLLRGHTAGRPPARRARLHAHRCTLVRGKHTGLEAALLLAYMSVCTTIRAERRTPCAKHTLLAGRPCGLLLHARAWGKPLQLCSERRAFSELKKAARSDASPSQRSSRSAGNERKWTCARACRRIMVLVWLDSMSAGCPLGGPLLAAWRAAGPVCSPYARGGR